MIVLVLLGELRNPFVNLTQLDSFLLKAINVIIFIIDNELTNANTLKNMG